MLYRAEPPALREARELGPMTVLYHRRSGITHMVTDPVPQILAALDDLGAADAATVAAHLAARFDIAEGDAAAVVAARLEELAALGLVARA